VLSGEATNTNFNGFFARDASDMRNYPAGEIMVSLYTNYIRF
jgi:hypothetical protein